MPNSVCAANAGEQFANPYVSAERGYVDAVIQPSDTHRRMTAALEMLDGQGGQEFTPKSREKSYNFRTFP